MACSYHKTAGLRRVSCISRRLNGPVPTGRTARGKLEQIAIRMSETVCYPGSILTAIRWQPGAFVWHYRPLCRSRGSRARVGCPAHDRVPRQVRSILPSRAYHSRSTVARVRPPVFCSFTSSPIPGGWGTRHEPTPR
eukprot:6173202-Pleurochrysis_carterae.AAC.2